jgi:hypothetical protein
MKSTTPTAAAGSGSPSFANAGTLRKTAGTGITTISLPCANTESVLVDNGTLNLSLTNGSGSFTAAAGATLSVSGTATLAQGRAVNYSSVAAITLLHGLRVAAVTPRA